MLEKCENATSWGASVIRAGSAVGAIAGAGPYGAEQASRSHVGAQLVGQHLEAALSCLADRVAKGLGDTLVDGGRDVQPLGTHGIQGPSPRLVFLQAARPMAAEADRVMGNLMEEYRAADRSLGIGRFDELAFGSVGISHKPRAAGRAASPLAHSHAVGSLHLVHQRIVPLLHRAAWPTSARPMSAALARSFVAALMIPQAKQVPQCVGELGHSGWTLEPRRRS